ncbi:MAG: PAS domain-containing protein, partial [Rhodospirillaceae bacterium]|nr:PAS domain-containing protein [Rhodospirillaceae bacterium]
MLLSGNQAQAADAPDAKKVLIVDDDRLAADALAAALDGFGYDLRVSATSQEARAELASSPAHVALLGSRNGDRDGTELISALREICPKILCIVLSARPDNAFAVQALRAGAFDVLAKPVDPDRLDAALDRCFDRLNLEGERDAAERALAASEARVQALLSNAESGPNRTDLHPVDADGDQATAQLDAEAKLRTSEASFRAIIDNYPSLISLKDLEGRYLLVNEAFAGRFDTTVDHAIGKTVNELQGPTPGDVVDAHDKEAIDRGIPVTRERSWEDEDGNITTRAVTKFPAYDADGELMGVGTISANVTARRRAEEAVRQSEQQLRLVIDSLPISIGYFDADLRYVLANKTHAEWNASTPDALIGRKIEEVRETPFPGFQRIVEQTLAGKVKSMETTADYPDGVTRDIQMTSVPDFGPDSQVRGFFGMAQDITERKRVERQHIEIEQRFRAVLDNFPAAIVLKDIDGRYLMVNKTFRAWLRIAPGEDCIGKTAHDFFPDEVADKVMAHERSIAAEGVSQVQERVAAFPDGITRRTWSHKFPIFGPAGECAAVGNVNIDV